LLISFVQSAEEAQFARRVRPEHQERYYTKIFQAAGIGAK
jgi:hypothetical protein